MWQPQPIDTSGVDLPPEIVELAETLAEQAHESWGKRRWDKGWRYGPKIDPELRRHHNMVPYADLPEQAKDDDRAMATQVLKLLVKLGYRIVPPEFGELLDGRSGQRGEVLGP